MAKVKDSSIGVSDRPETPDENISQPTVPQAPAQDTSTKLGQILYAIALESATNNCKCHVCVLARELAKLLAQQLREGGTWLKS